MLEVARARVRVCCRCIEWTNDYTLFFYFEDTEAGCLDLAKSVAQLLSQLSFSF